VQEPESDGAGAVLELAPGLGVVSVVSYSLCGRHDRFADGLVVEPDRGVSDDLTEGGKCGEHVARFYPCSFVVPLEHGTGGGTEPSPWCVGCEDLGQSPDAGAGALSPADTLPVLLGSGDVRERGGEQVSGELLPFLLPPGVARGQSDEKCCRRHEEQEPADDVGQGV
jgi:hypothetical protein